jgi:hypothetical protein
VNIQPLGPPFASFYFKNTTAFTGTNCATADGKRDADDAFAGNVSDSTFSYAAGTTSVNFCTRSLGPSDAIVAGTTKAYAWATNGGGSTCTVTADLGFNGVFYLSATASVPAHTSTPIALTWSFSTTAYTFAAGDRMNVEFTTPNGATCNGSSLVYGSTARRARLDLPISGGGQPVGAPSSPTNLQGTANADGSRTLTWTAPSGGNPVAFYRVYRDGVEYTQRYDQTGDASTTYTDPNNAGGQHSYYITAVSTDLAESSYVGPVAP